MKIIEGNVGRIEDIRPEEFNRGVCTYKIQYLIIDLQEISEDDLISIAKHSHKNFVGLPNIREKRYLVLKNYGPLFGDTNYSRSFFDTLEEVITALRKKVNESMDMKSRIKKALREDQQARKYSPWNPDSQKNIYQLDLFLRKSGYRLVDILNHEGVPELLIEPVKVSYLHPSITHNLEEGNFLVEVEKYGELDASDVEEVIKGYQTALGVVRHLESINLNNLELEDNSNE